jgi:O-antigen ligase/tetratricopeptide (TPR) repeat protein
MRHQRRLIGFAVAIAALIVAATILIGAVEDEYRYFLFGATLLIAAAAYGSVDAAQLPSQLWHYVCFAFPAWIIVSLVPWPLWWLRLLSPERAALHERLWPAGLVGCDATAISPALPDSVTLSLDPLTSSQFLTQVAAALAVVLVSAVFASRWGDGYRRRVLWGLAILGCLESLYGLGQWFSGTPMVLWYEKEAYLDSATGTLINRNHFAMLLYLAAGAIGTLLRAEKNWTTRGPDSGRPFLLLTLLAIVVSGLAASRSRAGFVLGLVPVALSLWPLWERTKGAVRTISLTLALLAGLALVVLALPGIAARLVELPSEWSGPQSRGALLRWSMAVIPRFPLFGCGALTFDQLFALYREPVMQARYVEAHNDYLQTLLETGVIGLLLALAPIALIARSLLRQRRELAHLPIWAALGMVLIHEGVDFPLRIPSLCLLVAWLVGSFSPAIGPNGIASAKRWACSAWFAVIGLFSIGLACAIWNGGSFAGLTIPEANYRGLVEALEQYREDPKRDRFCALLEMSAAVQQLKPYSAPYALRHARIVALELAAPRGDERETSALRQEFERATDRARGTDPWNTYLVREPLIGLELSQGNVDAALAEARIVVELNDTLAPSVIKDLYDAGIEPVALYPIALLSRPGLTQLFESLFVDQNQAALRAIVPADVATTPELCAQGAYVKRALKELHQASGLPFLERCLTLPQIQRERFLSENIAIWVVHELMTDKKWSEAKRLLPQIREFDRLFLGAEIAYQERDWETVRRSIRRLRAMPRERSEEGEAYLLTLLGDALAHLGDGQEAIVMYEQALVLYPIGDHLRDRIARVRAGLPPT